MNFTSETQNELEELVQIGKLFERRQWFLGTSGNLSCLVLKNPLQFAITASGIDKGKANKNSFIIINAEGKPVENEKNSNSLSPSGEGIVHSFLYQASDARSVIHIHTIPSLLVADLFVSEGGVSLTGLEVLKGLGCATTCETLYVPIVENQYDINHLAQAIVNSFKQRNHLMAPAVLVRHHGMFVWGDSVFSAKRHTELLSHIFEYLILKKSLGL